MRNFYSIYGSHIFKGKKPNNSFQNLEAEESRKVERLELTSSESSGLGAIAVGVVGFYGG